MGEKSGILYIDSSINPITGCTGCRLYNDDPAKNICYAAAMCRRYAGLKGWPKKFTEPEHFPKRLPKALRKWSDLRDKDRPDRPWLNGLPRIIFINDMSDGFCPGGVPPEVWLSPHLDAMRVSPHIWLFLTKWPKRMRRYFESKDSVPRNFWLGASVLDESDAHKLKTLLGMAALTPNLWTSYEPAMGIFPDLDEFACSECDASGFSDERHDTAFERCPSCGGTGHQLKWVAGGAASGHNGPDAQPKWFADVYEKAYPYRIPFFFKNWRKKDRGRQLYGLEYNETPWGQQSCLRPQG